MRGSNSLAHNVTNDLITREILKSTKEKSMKGSNSLAHNVTKDLLKRDILKSTKEQSMKGSNSLALNFFYTSTVRGENISMIKWTFKSSLFISFNRCYYTGFKAVFKFIMLNIFP